MASKGQKFKKHNSDMKEIILDRYLNGESTSYLANEYVIPKSYKDKMLI